MKAELRIYPMFRAAIASTICLLLLTGCLATPELPDDQPATTPPEAAEPEVPTPQPPAEPEELSAEAKFSLFQALMSDLDADGVLIVEIVSPEAGTAQVVVKEDVWYLDTVENHKALLTAWYNAWKNIYGDDARLEIMAQRDSGRYQIGGSKRDGAPSDLFLSTD